MDAPWETPEAAAASVARHLERGEPLFAYNEAQEGLARWPAHARLRQLQALALARSGDTERANALLDALAREGIDDAETLGMLARTHKDLALSSSDPLPRAAHLDSAFGLYRQAYERARSAGVADAAWYTGINAATMALVRGDVATARRMAAEVRDVCRSAAAQADSAARYWREATLGEAALILGDAREAAAHYAAARELAGARHGDVSSTRRQARLLAKYLPDLAGEILESLRLPPVVVFTGHMIDAPGRETPRFPAPLEPEVRAALGERLAAIGPLAVYSSAACGADLLCLELARERGCETHVILPFPPEDFRRSSVDFAGGDWSGRFDAALAAANTVTVTSDHHARGSTATYEYANLVLTGMGRLRAQFLDAPLRGIAVRDPGDRGSPGGSASNVALWRETGIDVDEISLGGPGASATVPASPASTTSPIRHEIRAMLFADAVGYSKLGEDQIPGYIAGFLGSIAELSRKTTYRFEHVETSGDGLYMVFRTVNDAARYALALNAMTRGFDREAWGLPPTFDLRIALHCGPVHCALDPLTGLPLYTGPHTSRAARIEPITPPGQVYASSAFAAVAAATGVDVTMSYVGRMPLAKNYGQMGLYHLK